MALQLCREMPPGDSLRKAAGNAAVILEAADQEHQHVLMELRKLGAEMRYYANREPYLREKIASFLSFAELIYSARNPREWATPAGTKKLKEFCLIELRLIESWEETDQ
jgi:hypothetical protein